VELGCGDGYIANKILSNNKIEKAVLIDGSNQMLMAAKERLNKFNNIEYRHISFQDLINKQEITGKYNLIFSSLAIHHLTLEEKEKLYRLIFDLLLTDGSFINYDVVLPSSLNLEPWYLDIWKNWIESNEQANPNLNNIPQQYKDNKDNIPSSLEEQLKILNDIGFNNVDCYFKYGVFAVFGGKKI
jgi:tRNA (cmo5U34)-methyltransferase